MKMSDKINSCGWSHFENTVKPNLNLNTFFFHLHLFLGENVRTKNNSWSHFTQFQF